MKRTSPKKSARNDFPALTKSYWNGAGKQAVIRPGRTLIGKVTNTKKDAMQLVLTCHERKMQGNKKPQASLGFSFSSLKVHDNKLGSTSLQCNERAVAVVTVNA